VLLDRALVPTGPGRPTTQRTKGASNQRAFTGIVGSCRTDTGTDGAADDTIGDLTVLRPLDMTLYYVCGVLLAGDLIGIEGRRRLVRPRHNRDHRSGRCRRAGCQQQQRRSRKDTRMNAFHDRISLIHNERRSRRGTAPYQPTIRALKHCRRTPEPKMNRTASHSAMLSGGLLLRREVELRITTATAPISAGQA